MSFLSGGHFARKGVALITTLFFLVVISILVVGFTVSMRTERSASTSSALNERSKLVAGTALAHAVSLLAGNIPSPSKPGQIASSPTNWTINPGRLTTIDQNGVTTIDLHSGEATSKSDLTSVDLNAKGLVTNENPISPGGEMMRVNWQPIFEDDSKPASATNKLSGRYAFWIDDECARINFNTAAGKPASTAAQVVNTTTTYASLTPIVAKGDPSTGGTGFNYALGHPASVNLDSLATIQPLLYQDAYTKGFRSPEAIRNDNYVANSSAFYNTNRFFLTAFSRAPEFNVFGKSRIFIACSQKDFYPLNYGGAYQHPTDNTQPTLFWTGLAYSGDNAERSNRAVLKPLLTMFETYLTQKNWPGISGGKNFADKWGAESTPAAGTAEVDQVALNMMAMGSLATAYTGSPGKTAASAQIWQRMGEINHINAGPDVPSWTPLSPDLYVWYGLNSKLPMMPQLTGPRLNEIAVQVFPELVAGSTTQYYLKYHVSVESYTPPDALTITPNANKSAYGVRTSYLSYTATGGTSTATQTFHLTKTPTSVDWTTSPLSKFEADIGTAITLQPDSYYVMTMPDYYMGTTSTVPITSGANRTKFTGAAHVEFYLRVGGSILSGSSGPYANHPLDLCPIYSPDADPASALYKDPASGGALKFVFDVSGPSALPTTKSYEANDARVNAMATDWTLQSTDSLGGKNKATVGDSSKNRYWNLNPPATVNQDLDNDPVQGTRAYPTRSAAIGMFSLISTGMQHGKPWQTLKFQAAGPSDSPPDYLILDLLAPAFMRKTIAVQDNGATGNAPEAVPISYMNSTAGKINLNSKIYPSGNAYFTVPPRRAPLDALFKNMPHADAAVSGIMSYQDGGKRFEYIGQVCEAPGVADTGSTDYEKEALVRHLASCMTTQSNTFGVYGAAQVVKKIPANQKYDTFEKGDVVLGEKRFYAVVERYVWPGRDGVPGNGHWTGSFDRMADNQDTAKYTQSPGGPPTLASAGNFAYVDGPDAPDQPAFSGHYPTVPATGAIDMADNPVRALMKYRINYFKYLDE